VLTARKDGFLNNQVAFTIKNNDDGSKEMLFTPKLEDVYVKAFVGRDKVDEASADSSFVDTIAPENKVSLSAKIKLWIASKKAGKEYPFADLLSYKKPDLRENTIAFQGVKAQHFIDDEFTEELLSDASGEVSFQTLASQANKITIAAVPENAKPVEKPEEVVEQVPVDVKDDLGWYKQGEKIYGKVVASSGGEIKRNTSFTVLKDGESAGTVQSDANGLVQFTKLDDDALYSLVPVNDEQTLVYGFNPTIELNKNSKEFTFVKKSIAVSTVLLDNQIEYDEIKVEELFLLIPAGDGSDEKVLGQIIFNNKKLQGLEVEIIVDDKSKTLAKTGKNKFFVTYMNPKKKNALQFVVNKHQYKVPLTEKDFKKRKKYFEIIVSVTDADNHLWVDDLELPNIDTTPKTEVKEIVVEPKKEVVVVNPVKEEVKTFVPPVAIVKENVNGIVSSGKAMLFDAEVKIFEEGEFVAKTKTDAQGHYTFAVKPDAIYTITVGKEGFKYEQKTFIANLLKENTGKIEVDFSLTYQKPVTITGQVMADNKPVADASVDVYKDDAVVKKTKTDTLGNYEIELREREKYTLSITKSGYFQSNTVIETKAAGDSANNVDVKVKLAPIEENKSVAIPNIYFEYNHWKLTDKSIVELDRLVVFLNQNPQIKVLQIFAYTDNVGSDEYNLVLSQKRANTVLEYLIKKGIPRQKVLATGMGEKDLIIKNAKSEEEHAKNRRTEFKVTLEQQ
jgi:outer membrane protein OmpA-like peptidoglycan-associated protein